MFRNVIAYPLPEGWPHSAAGTSELLARRTFQPCGAQDTRSSGFVPPRKDADLCHAAMGRYLISLQEEEKLLPASVVAEYADERAAELERLQGFRAGKRQMKEIKEEVVSELLPQAFTKKRRSFVWIDPGRRWMFIEASSHGRAESILTDLRCALDSVPVSLIATAHSPVLMLQSWLREGDELDRFSIDHDCELVSLGEGNPSVRFARYDLGRDDVRQHLDDGKVPVLLGVTFEDRISFIVDSDLTLKRILLLEILTKDRELADDAAEQFDADFILAASEIERAFDALIESAGGLEDVREKDLLDQCASSSEPSAASQFLDRQSARTQGVELALE